MKFKKVACSLAFTLAVLQSCSAVRPQISKNALKIAVPILGLVVIGGTAWALWPKKDKADESPGANDDINPFANNSDNNKKDISELFGDFVKVFNPAKGKYAVLSDMGSICPLEGEHDFVPQDELVSALSRAADLLKKDPKMVEVDSKGKNVIFVGDLHGDINTFRAAVLYYLDERKQGRAGTLVFLGDYGDRGDYSFEVLYSLALLKLTFPDEVVVLRGNHDVDPVFSPVVIDGEASVFGDLVDYYSDDKYNEYFEIGHKDLPPEQRNPVHKSLCDFYGSLPLAALIDNKTFCVHACVPLDPNIGLEEIKAIKPITDGESLVNDLRKKGYNQNAYNMLWIRSFANLEGRYGRDDGKNLNAYPETFDRFAEKNGVENIVSGHEPHNCTHKLKKVRHIFVSSSGTTITDIGQMEPDGTFTALQRSDVELCEPSNKYLKSVVDEKLAKLEEFTKLPEEEKRDSYFLKLEKLSDSERIEEIKNKLQQPLQKYVKNHLGRGQMPGALGAFRPDKYANKVKNLE